MHHATRIIGVSTSHQIRGLVDLIAGEDGSNRYASLDHLQHTSDIYLAGHFLLSVEVDRGTAHGAPAPAAELFAASAPDDVVRDYRRAFTLAALFHDIGHVLSPPDSRPPSSSRARIAPGFGVVRFLPSKQTSRVTEVVFLSGVES